MNVLHIANDYLGSTVYKELYAKLAAEGIKQTVYSPVRDANKHKFNDFCGDEFSYNVIFSPIMKRYHSILFGLKTRFLYKHLYQNVDVNNIDVVHATTLFSDGILAYKLFKKHQIKYIVTIRNTDINIFFKYFIHLRSLGIEILRNSYKIVFISPVYAQRFFNNPYIQKYASEYVNKAVVIPNGVNDFWVRNCKKADKEALDNSVQLLYIGKFTKGKNIHKLVKSVEELNIEKNKYHLHVVGGGGDKGETENWLKTKNFITFHGKIYNKQMLKSLMHQCHIFTMPSKSETFGLVYIEALTQGLPVIYTKDEGIDGLYDNIGEAVDPFDTESIKTGIKCIAENYMHYHFNLEKIIQNHNWEKIAKKYISIYNQIN